MKNRRIKKSVSLTAASAIALGTVTPAAVVSAEEVQGQGLMISQYVEGGGFNKAIELYNSNNQEIDLANYDLQRFSNGGETGSSVNLSGTIAPGGTYTVVNGQADPSFLDLADEENGGVSHNGNDQYGLFFNDQLVDSLGQKGNSSEFAKDVTLVRKSSVTSGDTNFDDAFDASQWDEYAKDSTENLGQHTIDQADESTFPSIQEVKNGGIEQEVTFEGTISTGIGSWGSKGFYMQDGSAGISVSQDVYEELNQGDYIEITGTTGEYNHLFQLSTITDVKVKSSGNTVSPQTVTPSQVNEDNEGALVKLEGVTISDIEEQNFGTFEFTATNGSESVVVRVDSRTGYGFSDFTFEEGDVVDITGISGQFYDTRQVLPRGEEDLQLVSEGTDDSGSDQDGEISVSSIADVRAGGDGQTVTVEGVVTSDVGSWGGDTFYIQDETDGLYVYENSLSVDLERGDLIEITGDTTTYNGVFELINTSAITVKGEGTVPDPEVVTPAQISKDNQGSLVEVQEVTISDIEKANSYGTLEFTAMKDGESVLVRVDNRTGYAYSDFPYQEGMVLNVTGLSSEFSGTPQLQPRDGADIEFVSTGTADAIQAMPASGGIMPGEQVALSSFGEGDIYYTTDGSEPTKASTMYAEPIEITEDTTIKAIFVTDEETSSVVTFDYTVLEATDGLQIHDIQGATHESLYDGQNVTNVSGIVTQKIGNSAFYMQAAADQYDDDVRTSEGIYVSVKDGANISVGDQVSVSGTVEEVIQENFLWFDFSEDLSVTKITGASVSVSESDADLPEPVILGEDGRQIPYQVIDNDQFSMFDPSEDAIDFYESLEGMRVAAPNATVVMPRAQYTNYDETAIIVPNGADKTRTPAGGIIVNDTLNPERMIVDDYSQDMEPIKVGDTFASAVTGVIGYEFSNFKLEVNALPEVNTNSFDRETTTITKDEEKLTVATYNMENYFATDSEHPEKTDEIAASIVNRLNTPDVVGLVEVQDNNGAESGGTDASENYEALIAAIEAQGGPTYAYTDIAPQNNQDGGQPDGNIRVGFIYNPERVSLVDQPKGDATTAVGVTDEGSLSLNPGRIDPMNDAFADSRKPLAAEFEFNGENVIVVANHFNSKGGDEAPFGGNQPAELKSEVQRLKQAEVVHGFVQNVLEKDDDANVVVLGDLNDFENSAPIDKLEGSILTNMIEMLPENERYTYNYQGNSQVLDHILVADHLKDQTEVDIVHLNADFTEEQGRVSDHDPVLIQMEFVESNEGNFENPTGILDAPSHANVGETFTVDVHVENLMEATAADFTVHYQHKAFELLSVESPYMMHHESLNKNMERIVLAAVEQENGLSGQPKLATLTFETKAKAKGKYKMKLKKATVSDAEGNEVKIKSKPVKITVSPKDLNKDGKITVGDIGLFIPYYQVEKGSSEWNEAQKADFNKDGIVDMKDFRALTKEMLKNK